jgi:hypothetical protein
MPIRLEYLHKPKLKQPVMIAGLPGIANVGKLAIEFLIHQLRARKFLEFHSEHLPEWAIPDAGEIRTLSLDFFHARPDGMKRDLILLTGDAQAATPRGQYALTGEILNIAEGHGVTTVATMAAYVLSVHEIRMKPVVAAVSSARLAKLLAEKGVGMLNSGLIDPKASGAVLRALGSITGFSIDTTELTKHAEELKSRLPRPPPRKPPEEEVSYIR